MPRIDDPKPDLQKLRLGIGLSSDEAARRLGITTSILVHYESKGYGYDPEHDAAALDAYIVYAIAAYGSPEVFHGLFPIEDQRAVDRPLRRRSDVDQQLREVDN